jgi:hypothetical protein
MTYHMLRLRHMWLRHRYTESYGIKEFYPGPSKAIFDLKAWFPFRWGYSEARGLELGSARLRKVLV